MMPNTIRPFKLAKVLDFFCQSGEISPNLVTLGMRERGWVGGLEVPKVGLVFLTLKFGSIFRVVFFSVKLTLL